MEEDNSELLKDSKWMEEDEQVLKQWADISQCYKWMHSKAYNKYYKIYLSMTIPVIIISTLTGTANFAQEQLPIEYRNYFLMGVGAFNILVGIISTIMQFIKVGELKEAHSVSSKSWDKFCRNLQLELVKNPDDRSDKNTMMDIAKKEFDRLIESSPDIPSDVVKIFTFQFKNHKDLFKPDICDNLIPTPIYRRKENVKEAVPLLSDPKIEVREKFKEKNGRYPTEEELNDILLIDV
jgi:hypothetical protein